VFHVHTNRSPDSSGSIEEAVAAARRARLQFVVATEHGDGTRMPMPPAYHGDVLWIDGVEVSTTDGHYATFGMSQAPYPLAGDARDVAEDVRRLGGVGVAAHGDSVKSEAQWRDWNAPIDGVEWLNLDSVWREAGIFRLGRALLTYWFHPATTLDALGARPTQSLAHLDAVAAGRHVMVLAATDAHGRMLPSYDACFGAFSTRVELEHRLSGDAASDAAVIVAALGAGHHYTVLDGLAASAGFDFSARHNGTVANEGDTVPAGVPVTFDMHLEGQPDAKSVLLKDGAPVQDSLANAWSHATGGEPGEYRVEVTLPSSPGTPPLPWILSNPIYVGERATHTMTSPALTSLSLPMPLRWHVEKDTLTSASLASDQDHLQLHVTLGSGAPANQFAAAASAVPSAFASSRGLRFTVGASKPMRLSVELRGKGDRRWERSIYADDHARPVLVTWDDMRPVAPNADAHPTVADVESLLLLVGVSHTAPGTAVDVDVSGLALQQ
jgi:hypothetical protein